MKHPLPFVVLPLTLWFAGCESMPTSDDSKATAAVEDVTAGKQDEEESDDDPGEAVAKAERDLEDARIEQSIAKAEIDSAKRKAQEEVESAENSARVANEALAHFRGDESQLELSKVALGLDQARWRLEAEKQELAELEAMYKKDDVATLTKELVLQRGKKGVEFAERDLMHEQKEADAKRDFELPRKLRELEVEAREKGNALDHARAEQQKSEIELGLKARKAKAEVDDAEKDLAKARKKAEKAAQAKAAKKGGAKT